MNKTLAKERVTLTELQKDVDSLKKKFFTYETLEAEKEIRKKKVRGPFRSGKDVIDRVKR